MAKKHKKDEQWLQNTRRENEMTQLMRSLKKYCVIPYKEYLKIRYNEGNAIVPEVLENGDIKFNLTTTPLFKKAFGQISVTFRGQVLVDVQPREYFYKGYMSEYTLYKGIFISNDPKDRFKIDFILSTLK